MTVKQNANELILVFSVFDPSLLQKDLADDGTFRFEHLTRFPFIPESQLQAYKEHAGLIFFLIDQCTLSNLSEQELSFFSAHLKQLGKSTAELVFCILPSLTFSGLPLAFDFSSQLAQTQGERFTRVVDFTFLPSYLKTEPPFRTQNQFMLGWPYSIEMTRIFADYLHHLIAFRRGVQKKLIIVDFDGTLWDGTIEETAESHGPIAQDEVRKKTFVDFQKTLLELKNSGFLLAICSKNEIVDVRNFFARSRDFVITESSFATISASWDSKDRQIQKILNELGFDERSFIFIDDSLHEIVLVKSRYPGAVCAQLPLSIFDRTRFLKRITGYHNPFMTKEDKLRHSSYEQNQQRKALQLSDSDGSWIEQLQGIIQVEKLSASDRGRAEQILYRTNQFILDPGRRSLADLEHEALEGKGGVLTFRYNDRLGDDGIIGLAVYTQAQGVLYIKQFVLSCRVFGRDIEYGMLEFILEIAKAKSLKQTTIHFSLSARNSAGARFIERVADKKPSVDVGEYKAVWKPGSAKHKLCGGSPNDF